MNIDNYISSGILELYVAGVLLEDEAQEVSVMIQKYPQIAAEVTAIEQAILTFTQQYSPSLAPALKNTILEGLNNTVIKPSRDSAAFPPLPPDFSAKLKASIDQSLKEEKITKDGINMATIVPPVQEESALDKPSVPIVSLYSKYTQYWKYATAAAVVLFLISGGINVYLYYKWQNTDKELISLHHERSILAGNLETLKTNFQNTTNQLDMLREPATKMVQLAGLDVAPHARAIVYWSPTHKHVYLDANGMPIPPKGKQYQLWYIDEEGPKDAGIFDYTKDKDNFYQLKDVSGTAQAFAISLEPLGGRPTPTKVYAVGKLQVN